MLITTLINVDFTGWQKTAALSTGGLVWNCVRFPGRFCFTCFFGLSLVSVHTFYFILVDVASFVVSRLSGTVVGGSQLRNG